MASDPTQITHDFPPFLRVHHTGRVERYMKHDFVPPSHDPLTGVVSKDLVISDNVSARIYLPQNERPDSKLPLIIYIHGGAFTVESAFSSQYHPYVNSLSAQSRSLVVSIEYRLAPEHPIPACYEDSWAVTKWVESHNTGQGPDQWLNDRVDFERVFLVGDSSGANIGHDIAIRASLEEESGIRFAGLVLIHPFFGNGKNDDKLWKFICPAGSHDSSLNPVGYTDLLSKLRCGRVLVCLAENDFLRKRGLTYYEALKNSDWNGVIEIFESKGEGHVFHLFDGGCEKAVSLSERIVGFVNWGMVPSVL